MLEITNLTKTFGETIAVDNFTFSVTAGKPYGLLGRNGAGKTTTIKMLLGLIRPDQGQIRYQGVDLQREKLSLGYLPEERGLYLEAKIGEQLAYFAKLEGCRQMEREIDYWLERFELGDAKTKKAKELSKGNKQKVQLIATLLHNPELLILDEPFSGLDPVNTDVFTDIIREQAEQQKLIIISSHQMPQMETICERVAILKSGKMKLEGELAELRAQQGECVLQLPKTAALLDYVQTKPMSYEASAKELRVLLATSTDALHFLNELQQQAIPVAQFACVQPSLHDIFVKIAK